MKIAAYYYAGADLYHLWSTNCNNNGGERETAFGLTAPLICRRASNCERCQRARWVFVQPRHPRALNGDTHTHTDESSPVGFINLQLACAWSHVVHNATCSCVNCVVCHTHPGDTQRLWLAGAEWELQPRRMTTKGKGGRRGGGVRRRQMNSSSLGSTLYWQQRSRWEMESTCGAGDGEAWGGPLAPDVRGGRVTC